MYLEMSVEYEDYLKKMAELNLEESEEYNTIVEAFKDRIRELIKTQTDTPAKEEPEESEESKKKK